MILIWAAALLMAMLEVDAGAPVLLCVYDHPMPAPYARLRPVIAPFGLGLVRRRPPASARAAGRQPCDDGARGRDRAAGGGAGGAGRR